MEMDYVLHTIAFIYFLNADSFKIFDEIFVWKLCFLFITFIVSMATGSVAWIRTVKLNVCFSFVEKELNSKKLENIPERLVLFQRLFWQVF